MRYNYETLTTYCSENEIQINPIDKTKCNRETVIEGKCKTPTCLESFIKSFRQMVKCGGFCEECCRNNGMKRYADSQTDKHFKSLTDYCVGNEIQLLKSYEGEMVNRDTIIEGNCKTPNCNEPFCKPLRQLLKIGGFCAECSKDNGKVKIVNTNLEKFGCKNAMQNKDVRETQKLTMLSKYGVEHNSQSEIIKQQKKDKSISKYGVEYVLQSPTIRKQIVETNKIRYGAENPQQNKEIHTKTTETNLEKYGAMYLFSLEEFKEKSRQTNLRKYGAIHHLQNAEYAEKHMKAAYKTKQYTMPSGKIVSYQGYENFGLDELLLNEKIDETDITTSRTEVPEIWYFDKNGKRRRHFVDIFIKSQNRCIEIKSTWTHELNNNVYEKQAAAIELGYKYDVWIYDRDGNKIQLFPLLEKVEQKA
jgi:hypothetical protein